MVRRFRIKIDEKIFEAEVEEVFDDGIKEQTDGLNKNREKNHKKEVNTQLTKKAHGSEYIVAPMPGKVLHITCEEGQNVHQGDVLLIFEAMKMEQEIKSNKDGTVAEIKVKEGDTITKDEILIIVA